MARIPEDEVERLKREVSVQRLAEARGVKLTRHGADLIGLCPFHEDHSPSLVISSGEKSVELSRRVPRGRHGDRLGDARRRHQLPSCGGAAERRSSSFSRVTDASR